VLSVGQCGPDTAALKHLVESNFDAKLSTADHLDEALEKLQAGDVALVLVNRKLDVDYSDGLEIIRRIKADAALASVPVMLVSNYDDAQQSAVEAGAEPGFGKSEMDQPQTHQRLKAVLG